MIKTLSVKEFTTLPNAEFHFCRGLNIVLAENGMGKSHLLKLLYTVEQVLATDSHRSKNELSQVFGEKLVENFRSEALGRLVRRHQGRGKTEVLIKHQGSGEATAFTFTTASKKVALMQMPEKLKLVRPIFIPTRELATLCPWFVGLYDNYHVGFEGTWRDTCSLLSAPTKKGSRTVEMSRLLEPLEEALGGSVTVDKATGKLLVKSDEGNMEMALVAEGLRKIAMLVRLISTGALTQKGTLFWDEPEANLNPKYIRIIAKCIWELAAQGIQFFVATHSVFLVRELYLLDRASVEEKAEVSSVPEIRWFALSGANKPVEAERDLWQLQTFVAFDSEAEQNARFLTEEG